MSAVYHLTATETKLFFREPTSVIFTLLFPPLLLVILGVIPAFREADEALGGARVIDLYAPIVVALGLTTVAITSLPQQFATYREKGVLRRMRTTPVKPTGLLGAQLVTSMLMCVVTTLVVLTVGQVLFDVRLPQHLPAYLLAFVLSALSLFAIGLLVASLAPHGTGAGAIGLVLFFPLLFFAGLWIPRSSMNSVLLAISDFSPLGAGVQSLQDATAGAWPQALHVAVLLGWSIVAGGLAVRYFRWE